MSGVDLDGAKYSDTELVKLIVGSGQTEYFSILYDRYAPFIYNKSYSFVRNEEEAKDLTHDVFIKIYVNLFTYKGKSELFTWIYSVTLHTCIKYINKKKNLKITFSENLENEANWADELIDDASETEQLFNIGYEKLYKILEKIPVDDKLLLLMKYQDDLPIKQICEILNLKESTVKMRLLRAKKKVLTLSEN